VVVLTVVAPPFIVAQPTNQTVAAGASVSFSVSATAIPAPVYQWQLNGADIAGATSSNYTFSAEVANAGAQYRVVISNAAGATNSAVVTFLVPPKITSNPEGLMVGAGKTVRFDASVSGMLPLAYQWRFNGAVLTNNAHASGTDTGSLVLSNVQTNDTGNYSILVTNIAGAATGSVAVLVVVEPPMLMSFLVSNTLNLSFSIQTNFSYQIQSSSDLAGTNWTTLTNIPAQTNAGSYLYQVSTTNDPARFYRIRIQ
jgi:hypothetical protein